MERWNPIILNKCGQNNGNSHHHNNGCKLLSMDLNDIKSMTKNNHKQLKSHFNCINNTWHDRELNGSEFASEFLFNINACIIV